MAEARYVSGPVTMMDYTPSGADVAAGEIILVGDYTGIAHLPIAKGELGALAIDGGIYEVVKDGTGGPTFNQGDYIDWDADSNLAVAAGSGNGLGMATADAGTNDASVYVFHRANGLADGT